MLRNHSIASLKFLSNHLAASEAANNLYIAAARRESTTLPSEADTQSGYTALFPQVLLFRLTPVHKFLIQIPFSKLQRCLSLTSFLVPSQEFWLPLSRDLWPRAVVVALLTESVPHKELCFLPFTSCLGDECQPHLTTGGSWSYQFCQDCQRTTLSISLQKQYLKFLRQGLFIGQDKARLDFTQLAVQGVLESHLSLSFQGWDYKCVPLCLASPSSSCSFS